MQSLRLKTFLGVFAMFLLLSACTQQVDETFDYQAAELFGADYLKTFKTPKVMFHYSIADEENKNYQGWLIDNEGKVRTYQLNYPVTQVSKDKVIWEESSVERLYNSSARTNITVDLNVLVEQYKKNWQISHASITQEAEDAQAKVTTAFWGFTLAFSKNGRSGSGSHHSGGGCNNGGGESSSTRQTTRNFNQILLQSEGSLSLRNDSEHAAEIVDWMQSLHQGL